MSIYILEPLTESQMSAATYETGKKYDKAFRRFALLQRHAKRIIIVSALLTIVATRAAQTDYLFFPYLHGFRVVNEWDRGVGSWIVHDLGGLQSRHAPTPQVAESEPVPSESESPPQVNLEIATADTDLNIRANPHCDGEVLGQIPGGATVTLLGDVNDGWYQIQYEGISGWASGHYLSGESVSPDIPPQC